MSGCSCISGNNWRFDIEYLDVKTLRYTDYSDWQLEEPYRLPDTHRISIHIPASGKTTEIDIIPGGSKIITAQDLGAGNCIEDGIYCISAYSCLNCATGEWGEKLFTQQKAIMPQVRCKIDNLIATGIDSKKSKELDSKLKQIESITKIGQSDKAAQMYTFLQDELDQYNCEKCC